ncbi:MAG: O-antigen ligase family protein [Chitinophagales bacterium]|nr:O-antigen ligase family protein [Chitinophagales bacterium]
MSELNSIHKEKSMLTQPLFLFGLASVVCIMMGFALDQSILFLLPFVLIVIGYFFLNFQVFYFLLLASIPLCLEFELPGGISTDLPSEPLCVALMGAAFIYLAVKRKSIDFHFLKHPIAIALFITFLWAMISTMQSVIHLVSIKYCLSKIWFITTYFILTILLVNNPEKLKHLFWFFFIPLFATVVYTLAMHSTMGFSFENVNNASLPFYRNHVIYAAVVTIFYPLIWIAATWYPRGSFIRQFLKFNQFFFLVAIYFSYTRACLLAIIVGALYYFVIKFKLVKVSVITAIIGLFLFTGYMFYDNKYLQFAPEYTKTIYHDSYDNHLEATFEGHDASSMERINMWIGALRTFPHFPFFGTGPGNFYPTYKSYTVIHFNTWVSDNEQHLSCHNYFLLMLVEQGIFGLLFFLVLTCFIFFHIEHKYSASKSPDRRRAIAAIGIAMVMLYVNLTLSDLIETTKIGGLFFILLALLVNIDKLVPEKNAI